jgi:hypothetical protein
LFNYNDEKKYNISVAAYFLAQKKIAYDYLCWMLAERQLYLQNNFQQQDENSIQEQAKKISLSTPTYDVLCWLISEIDLILKMTKFQGKNKPSFILP